VRRIRGLKDENGDGILLSIFFIFIFIAVTGVVVDMGIVYKTKSELRKVANAAVLSGAQELTRDQIYVRGVVNDILKANGEEGSLIECLIKPENQNKVKVTLEKNVQLTFMKLFNFARSKSNIVIIDTWTGLNEITLQAISNSNIDFLVFDSDLMHFHLNKQIIEQLDSDFIAEKTYAIINNCNTLSESYKYIYKQISKLKKGFKNIMPLSSCGSLGCDLMHTGRTPYNTTSDYNSSFKKDMDDILKALNTRSSKYGLMQP
jgi:hypothetical protein